LVEHTRQLLVEAVTNDRSVAEASTTPAAVPAVLVTTRLELVSAEEVQTAQVEVVAVVTAPDVAPELPTPRFVLRVVPSWLTVALQTKQVVVLPVVTDRSEPAAAPAPVLITVVDTFMSAVV
jgi:hypothetical protein